MPKPLSRIMIAGACCRTISRPPSSDVSAAAKAQILALIEQHPDTLDGDGLGIADGHGLRIDLIAHGSHAGE
jgi:hypothetical protein